MLKASVVIPVYNNADIVKKALDALAHQSIGVDLFEIIIVNDNSTDDLSNILLSPTSLNITVINNNERRGAAFSRNRGMDVARGELLVFCDGDTVPHTGFLEQHIKTHEQVGADNIVVIGRVANPPEMIITPLMELGNVTKTWEYISTEQIDPDDWSLFRTTNASLKRAFADIRFNDSLFEGSGMEDTEFAFRLHKKGMRIVYNPEALSFHYHFRTPKEYEEKVFGYGKLFARWIKSCDKDTAKQLNKRFNYLIDTDNLFSLYNLREIIRRAVINDLSVPLIRLFAKAFIYLNEDISVFLYNKLYKYLFLKGYKQGLKDAS